ncbi:NrsF family protein [Paraburkholderia domus]|uniref:NrsF family protein n=1 Tax=Paraburkholderia domus TaxID=2793075 RepID=UPI0022A89C28|nr:NrsF family protein [Paraburkholderia domus]
MGQDALHVEQNECDGCRHAVHLASRAFGKKGPGRFYCASPNRVPCPQGIAPPVPPGSCALLTRAAAMLACHLHCPEMGIPCKGVSYLPGMLVPTVIGALLGPRLQRW